MSISNIREPLFPLFSQSPCLLWTHDELYTYILKLNISFTLIQWFLISECCKSKTKGHVITLFNRNRRKERSGLSNSAQLLETGAQRGKIPASK